MEQEEIDNLVEIRDIIQRKTFQDMIVQPMREYQDKLDKAYNCKTLTELHTVKGKKHGSDEFFNILKRISIEFKNKEDE